MVQAVILDFNAAKAKKDGSATAREQARTAFLSQHKRSKQQSPNDATSSVTVNGINMVRLQAHYDKLAKVYDENQELNHGEQIALNGVLAIVNSIIEGERS